MPTNTSPPGKAVPLSNAAWTQEASETDGFIGTLTMQVPASCPDQQYDPASGMGMVALFADGQKIGSAGISWTASTAGTEASYGIDSLSAPTGFLFEPGAPTPRTITAKVGDSCKGVTAADRFVVTKLQVNAVALR
jgi:hypothetical protein